MVQTRHVIHLLSNKVRIHIHYKLFSGRSVLSLIHARSMMDGYGWYLVIVPRAWAECTLCDLSWPPGLSRPSSKPATHTRASRAECACTHVKMSSVGWSARSRTHCAHKRWHWNSGCKSQWGEWEKKEYKIKIHKEWKRVLTAVNDVHRGI